MSNNFVDIPMIIIGYNDKGLVGFIKGGKYLNYIDDVPVGYFSIAHYADENHLPFISEDDVRAVNARKEKKK